MDSKIDSFYFKHDASQVCQGDIFRDYELPTWFIDGGKTTVSQLKLPYVVVLTQECDLSEDFKNHNKKAEKQDAYLQSILVCPAYQAELLREGKHLLGLSLIMERHNSERWNLIINNRNHRYHYLEANPEYQIPPAVLDFKHYYTIPRNYLYNTFRDHYIGTINELFREALSQRFAFYLSRIGLPKLGKCDV